MSKYQFRLAAIRKLRETTRDQRRAALAEAFRAADLLAANREEVAAEQIELRRLQRSASVGRYLDVNRLVEAQRYELLLKARAEELAKQAALVAAEIERRRQLLVEADRDVRALELLDERQRREHQRRQVRSENRLLDESALVSWRTS